MCNYNVCDYQDSENVSLNYSGKIEEKTSSSFIVYHPLGKSLLNMVLILKEKPPVKINSYYT